MTHQLYGRAFVDGAIRDDVLITIDEGLIADVEQTVIVPPKARRLSGVIVPGFIDVHVHGGDGADFMDADAEAVTRVIRFHARHGTTALAATTLSAARGDLRDAIEMIGRMSAARIDSASEIVGVHLEGPFIHELRAGAQDRKSLRPGDIHELAALIATAPELRWIVTVAPEIEGVTALIEHFRDRILFSIGHTTADYGDAVAALAAGARHFTHLYNAMSGLGHREPGVVGAALTSTHATAELIADGVHVHPVALRLAVLAMPHRIALVTDAMRACGLGDGTYRLYDYAVEVVRGEARLSDGTLAGSTLTMDAAVRNMIELAGLPIEIVLPLATEVPARIAGVADRKGKIETRYDADLVVMNAHDEVERVWIRGSEIEVDDTGRAGDSE